MGIDLGTFLDVTRDIQGRTYNKKSSLKKKHQEYALRLTFSFIRRRFANFNWYINEVNTRIHKHIYN